MALQPIIKETNIFLRHLDLDREVMKAAITGKPYPVTAAISLASNPHLPLPNTRQVFGAVKLLNDGYCCLESEPAARKISNKAGIIALIKTFL
ncbi:MAG: hypothetical protein AB7U43_13735 [Desulfobacter sp.]|jgi:hypothetical protein